MLWKRNQRQETRFLFCVQSQRETGVPEQQDVSSQTIWSQNHSAPVRCAPALQGGKQSFWWNSHHFWKTKYIQPSKWNEITVEETLLKGVDSPVRKTAATFQLCVLFLKEIRSRMQTTGERHQNGKHDSWKKLGVSTVDNGSHVKILHRWRLVQSSHPNLGEAFRGETFVGLGCETFMSLGVKRLWPWDTCWRHRKVSRIATGLEEFVKSLSSSFSFCEGQSISDVYFTWKEGRYNPDRKMVYTAIYFYFSCCLNSIQKERLQPLPTSTEWDKE